MMEKYCKLYVNSSEKGIIKEAIQTSLGSMNLAETEVFYYIDKNDDTNPQKALNKDDGFLYYNYLVDIDSNSLIIEQIIKFIRKVMIFLIKNNIKVVASCDYENEIEGLKEP